MTKSDLIDAIFARGEEIFVRGDESKARAGDQGAKKKRLTKADAEQVVNCVFEAMSEALCRGEGIEIRRFGSFTVRSYKPYTGRNPRTSETVDVPAKRLPFFKVGKELRELVDASRHYAISGGGDDA